MANGFCKSHLEDSKLQSLQMKFDILKEMFSKISLDDLRTIEPSITEEQFLEFQNLFREEDNGNQNIPEKDCENKRKL